MTLADSITERTTGAEPAFDSDAWTGLVLNPEHVQRTERETRSRLARVNRAERRATRTQAVSVIALLLSVGLFGYFSLAFEHSRTTVAELKQHEADLEHEHTLDNQQAAREAVDLQTIQQAFAGVNSRLASLEASQPSPGGKIGVAQSPATTTPTTVQPLASTTTSSTVTTPPTTANPQVLTLCPLQLVCVGLAPG